MPPLAKKGPVNRACKKMKSHCFLFTPIYRGFTGGKRNYYLYGRYGHYGLDNLPPHSLVLSCCRAVVLSSKKPLKPDQRMHERTPQRNQQRRHKGPPETVNTEPFYELIGEPEKNGVDNEFEKA